MANVDKVELPADWRVQFSKCFQSEELRGAQAARVLLRLMRLTESWVSKEENAKATD